MNRTDLFALAGKCRVNGKLDREKLRKEIIEYFKSDEGQKVLQETPRVTIDYGDNVFDSSFPLQEQSLEKIAELIMQEVD